MTSDVDLAEAAALAGAAVVRDWYGRPLTRQAKSATDFATEADVEAEQAIKAAIRAVRPDDAFLGEEGGLDGDPAAERTWLVDPLCGTLNFAAQNPLVGVNVALSTPDGVAAAAVADPFSGEVFRTDDALSPSPLTRLVDIDVNDPAWTARLLATEAFASRFGVRVLSTSLAAAWVAVGRRAGYLQRWADPASVHFAAPIALCRAAGCLVTDLDGGPLHPDGGLVLAADADTHAALLAAVAQARV